jgi:hypothetical protein
MPLMMRKLSFTSEVKFVYLLFLRNFYFVSHLNTMRDMESWAGCYCHLKKCQCKCTFTVIMFDIFKKTVKLT